MEQVSVGFRWLSGDRDREKAYTYSLHILIRSAENPKRVTFIQFGYTYSF